MKNSQFNLIRIQNTHIKTVRFEWCEEDTDFVAELPISWILQTLGLTLVTDAAVNGAIKSHVFRGALVKYATALVAKAKTDFPEQIASLTCSDQPIPKEFAI